MSGFGPRARDLAALQAPRIQDRSNIGKPLGCKKTTQRLWKSARLRLRSRSPAKRSGEPDAESRIQSPSGDFDRRTPLEKARRLDDGDRDIFDDRYPLPDRALYFPGQRRFLERFRAKWIPVRVKKTRQNKRLESGSDSIRTDKALSPSPCSTDGKHRFLRARASARGNHVTLRDQSARDAVHRRRCGEIFVLGGSHTLWPLRSRL